jgi:hypothetical protein
MAKLVSVTDTTKRMIDEISKERRKDDALVCTKGGIIAEVIIELYKKEMLEKKIAI